MPFPGCGDVSKADGQLDACASIAFGNDDYLEPKLPMGSGGEVNPFMAQKEKAAKDFKELQQQVDYSKRLLEQSRNQERDRRREIDEAQIRLKMEEDRAVHLQAVVGRLSREAATLEENSCTNKAASLARNAEQLAKNTKPALPDTELLAAFLGAPPAVGVSGKLPGVERGGCPRGEPKSEQHQWIMACGLPDPCRGSNPKSKNCISKREADQLYSASFVGEETADGSLIAQHKNFLSEKSAFLEAFNQLPTGEDGKGKRVIGEEPKNSDWHRQKESNVRIQNFMELFMNVVVTKLAMHCQLTCRTCSTEDLRTVLILVTCTTHDLLKEADRQAFPTALDVEVVDPLALEPCTPKTYFPLLTWFLKEQPPDTENDELVILAKKMIERVKACDDKVLNKFSKEAAFYLELDDYLTNFADNVRKLKQVRVLSKGMSMSLADGEETWCPCLKRFQQPKVKVADEIHFLDPSEHIGPPHEVTDLRAEFLEYLRAKLQHGLGNSIDILKQVNSRSKLPPKKQMVHLMDCLGVDVMCPYQQYQFPTNGEGMASYWKMHQAVSRTGSEIITPFGSNERIKLIKSVIQRHVDVEQLQNQGYLTAVFPLDSREKAVYNDGSPTKLRSLWGIPTEALTIRAKVMAFVRTVPCSPPLDEIRAYYGERVALYHALMGHLRYWLRWPAAIGIVTFLAQTIWPFDPKDVIRPPIRVFLDIFYAVNVSCWSTLMLESWKRKEVGLATKWGMRGIEKNKHTSRPKHWGTARRSPVHDDKEIHFSWLRRLPRQILGYVCLLSLATVEMAGIFFTEYFRSLWELHDGLSLEEDGTVMQKWPMHRWAFIFTGSVVATTMFCFGKVGERLASFLNNFENYETSNQFMDNLIRKVFIFEFCNRFALYFFMAFIKANVSGCLMWTPDGTKLDRNREGKMCLVELQLQLRLVFLVEVMKNVVELTLPLIHRYLVLRATNPTVIAADLDSGFVRMSHVAQLAIEKESYGDGEVDGTFDDYKEIMILFGYITLFSVVFPLAPLMGSAVLQVESRVDGLKMYEVVRRPYPSSAETIGSWYRILDAMSWISMICNSALVCYTFGHFDNPPGYFGNKGRSFYFMGLVAMLVCARVLLAVLVPDIPENIHIIEQHQEWIRDCLEQEDKPHIREAVDIRALDLVIDQPESGELRDPLEFGVTTEEVRNRVSRLHKLHGTKIAGNSSNGPAPNAKKGYLMDVLGAIA